MDTVGEFCAITGASESEARNYLEFSGNVLEEAVHLYLEQNGQDGGGAQNISSSSTQSEGSRRKHSFDDPYSVYQDGDDYVRLPDQVKRRKLVDTDSYLENQNAKKITTAFSSGKRNMSEKEKTLSEIFRAPLDIMTQTGFEEAKDRAKSEDKWLLVNIQKDSEFQCHTLNRDFWSDECVKDMVICSFIFWQKLDVTVDGITYIAYYKVERYPYLAIIDPRTGAKKWEHKFDSQGGFDKKKLSEKLQDFLGDNPTPSESRGRLAAKLAPYPQVPTTTSIGNSSSSSSSSSSAAGVVFDGVQDLDASEDPELAAALRMSLQEAHSSQALTQESNGRDTTDGSRSSSGSGVEKGSNSKNDSSVPETVFSLPTLKKTTVDEPGFSAAEVLGSTNDADNSAEMEGTIIRAQLRLPGGAKATEKFTTTDEVLNVVRAIAKQIPAADASRRFDVHFDFPRRSLKDVLKEKEALQEDSSAQSPATPVTLTAIGVNADMVFFVTYL